MLRLVGINMNDLEESCMFLNGIEVPTFVTAAMLESSTVNTDATDLLDEHTHFLNQRHGIHALVDRIYQISTSRRMNERGVWRHERRVNLSMAGPPSPFHPPGEDLDDS